MRRSPFPIYAALLLISFSACKKDNDGRKEEIKQDDISQVDSRIQTFMTNFNVPGASLALSRHGKLVYRKGYGVADKTSNEPVTVNHRFRLASLAKTITALAIMKLVQENKLALNQKVFGAGAVLGTQFGATPYSTNVSNVTVHDLLRHTSGAGWSNAYPGDICFTNPTMTQAQLVDWGLRNQPLTTAPGTTYQYSNFGYLVLGRIIEKVSGKTYQNYIKQDLLAPLGISKTEIAGNLLADRKPNEVMYYGQGNEVSAVYTEHTWSRNDSPMGWISTPTELLMLLTAADSSNTRPDFLNSATLTAMRTPSTVNPYYASGIYVENDQEAAGSIWYHFGSLPGTQAILFRMTNGWCVSFVINTRYTNATQAQNAFASMLLEICRDETIQWQDIDQFPD